MSTIRPLATIAVLAALGVFLAFKINEAPLDVAQSDQLSGDLSITDEPPAWNSDAAASSTTDTALTARSAPSWADSAPAAVETKPEGTTAPGFPAMPALPGGEKPKPSTDLPPVQGVPTGSTLAKEPPQPTLPSASTQSLPLPAAIPTANYGSDATTVTSPTITGRVPTAQSTTQPATSTTVDSSASTASTFPSTSFPSETTPLTTTPVTTAAPAATALPASAPGFSAAWQAVEMALERDELTRAHRMLSQWRAEPNLTPEERQKVDSLLGQLAGSVVYSNEHRLEPAYVVQPGQTLATIAEEFDVPWQLLAKINGVAAVDAVQPGQQLKVIRGPFNAEVDLARNEVVLLLDDRYAGRFPVQIEGQAPTTGQWRVGQKRLDAPNQPVVGEGQKVVLENPTGEQVELSAGPTPPLGARGRLTIASNDMADLYDILSVGSAVTVRK